MPDDVGTRRGMGGQLVHLWGVHDLCEGPHQGPVDAHELLVADLQQQQRKRDREQEDRRR